MQLIGVFNAGRLPVYGHNSVYIDCLARSRSDFRSHVPFVQTFGYGHDHELKQEQLESGLSPHCQRLRGEGSLTSPPLNRSKDLAEITSN